MEDRERGFIVVHRRLKSWPLWRAMTANQRVVWLEMLLAANWAPSEVWVGGQRITIPRGAFIDTQDTLAEEAKVSRKVVRQTFEHLLAEGAITRATLGRQSGRDVMLTTIVNYDKYQSFTEREGHGGAAGWAADGASGGPPEGRPRAASEQDKPDQPASPLPREAGSLDRRTILGRAEALAGLYPATAAVLGRLNDQGIPMRHAADHDTRARVESVIAAITTDLAVSRASASFRENGRNTIGWHLKAIEGPKAQRANPSTTNPKAMAEVGQNWSEKPW